MQQRFETFTVLINRISRNIRKIKNLEMAEYDLRSVHVSCLYYLYRAGSLTATELCEHCEEDKATISRALDYLEARGYLTCQCKSQKRYKSLLTLTDSGTEVGKKIAGKIDAVLEQISVALSQDEREAFYRSLSLISESLDDLTKTSENEQKRTIL